MAADQVIWKEHSTPHIKSQIDYDLEEIFVNPCLALEYNKFRSDGPKEGLMKVL